MRIEKNALEWTVFGLGLAVVLVLVGFLGYATVTTPEGPASLRVILDQPQKDGSSYRTRVRVENVGEEAAIAPKVEVDGAEVDLDYVPRHSSREIYVVTERPPQKARVVGWQTP